MAQAYNHTILPLAGRRDKSLQVRWGIEVFQHYFQREPEGMWLPEAAVDTETLEVLAENGIRYTVLSPRQAQRVWVSGPKQKQGSAEHSLDTRRPYRCRLPSGREIVLFFYDGETAQRVAFERLLSDGEHFFRRMQSRLDPDRREPQLVHIAADGETFGHHHRFGEMALAYFISRLGQEERICLTNYGEYLALHPPLWEAEIVEGSSWSCAHGIERWRSDCGCRPSGSVFHQRWREPLRGALDHLKTKLDTLFEQEGRSLFRDPWQALDRYIQALLQRGPDRLLNCLEGQMVPEGTEEASTRALKLLEMQRQGQRMFTSCAWFFDEISGIETVQVLKSAARAIQLAERNFGANLEEEFLALLEQAPSNHPEIRNGRQLWEREVRPAVTDLERVLAHFAISLVFQRDPSPQVGYAYSVTSLDTSVQEAGHAHLVVGEAEVVSHVTQERTRAVYGVVHFGGMDVQFFWMPHQACGDYAALKADLTETFQTGSLGDLYERLLLEFKGPTHQLQDLFRDEQRRIVEANLRERVEDYQLLFEKLFDQDHALLKRLAVLRYPIPRAMRMAAEVCIRRRVRERAEHLDRPEDLQDFSQLLEQAKQWGYRVNAVEWERFLVLRMEQAVRGLFRAEEVRPTLAKAGAFLGAARLLEVRPNLWSIQNLFVEACKQRASLLQADRDAVADFAARIYLHPEALPEGLRRPQ
jgi:hypothetical protein